jgi:hypothetical protein
MTISEEIKNIKSNKSEWKKFGMTMGIILTIIGFYLIWKKNNNYYYPLSFAAAFFITGLFLSSLLKPVYKAWMILSVVMGFIVNKIIMVIIFYLLLTPLGLVASLTGKKFLDMNIDKNAKSYWIAREKTQKLKSDYERQF